MILSYIEQKNFIFTKIQIPVINVHKLLQFKKTLLLKAYRSEWFGAGQLLYVYGQQCSTSHLLRGP